LTKNFKAGDDVVFLDVPSNVAYGKAHDLTPGKTYKVASINYPACDCVRIKGDRGSSTSGYFSRFELAKKNFKKGDYVTCLNNALYEDKLTARGIYKVIDAHSTHGFDYIRVEGRGEVTVTAHSSRFKLWAAAEEFSKHPPAFPEKYPDLPKYLVNPKNGAIHPLPKAPPTTPPIMGLYIEASVLNGLVEDYVKKHYGIHQKVDKVYGGTEYIDVVFVK
jgi:hypothetical protein